MWWFTESPKLGKNASEIFEKCERGEHIIFVPSIVIAEALSIFDKKRIHFDFKELLKTISESENFVLISLDYPILQKMAALRDVPELHDKIIVSTAKHLNLPIVTKDEFIQSLQHIKTIW
ncbi:MAG: PIN domain-containing protein [Deltaproteobacteria bacterium]|nr:PIN domain-containing protein [Deltaproteobacteria bacterium]